MHTNKLRIDFVGKRKNHGRLMRLSQGGLPAHLREFATGVGGESPSSCPPLSKAFVDPITPVQRPHSDKIFSAYTKSYIHKESEQTLILCLKRLNELERNKKVAKLSQYIYELQQLAKCKVAYNVLKQIKLFQNLFERVNTQIGTESLSPSLLLSVAMSYKHLRLNKYTYFKNVLRAVCSNIRVYKKNKLTKLVAPEGRAIESSEDYKYTVELISKAGKQRRNGRRINMLNVVTNLLNNSSLSYVLYAYSTMFCSPNEYVLYMCKYILLNSSMLNHLDMLCILHFLRKTNVKIRKGDIVVRRGEAAPARRGEAAPTRRGEPTTLGKPPPTKGEVNYSRSDWPASAQEREAIRGDCPTGAGGEAKLTVNHTSELKTRRGNDPYDEHRSTYLKLLRCIIHIMKKRGTHFCQKPSILIAILYHFYKLNLVPIEIFYSFHNRIKREIKNVEVKSVALYLHILSDIQFDLRYYKCLYRHLTLVFEGGERQFDLLSVCLSFYSLARNRHYDECFVRACLELFRRHAHNLNDVNITHVVHTMGKLNVSDEDLLHKLCEVVARRMDSISPLNLSLIVLSLSKLKYQNGDFYRTCVQKGKELLAAFTDKQLVVFTYGLLLTQTFDYPFVEMFFRQYIRIGNTCNGRRRQMLGTICYCLCVERPSFLEKFPLSVNTFLKKNLHFVQEKEAGKMHEEVASILRYLRVDRFEILKRKHPYVFDISIGGGTSERELFVDFLLPRKLLRNSSSLSGFHQMKKRHMALLNVHLFHLDVGSYMGLPSMQDKVTFVRRFLREVCRYDLNRLDDAERGNREEIVNLVRLGEAVAQVGSLAYTGGSLAYTQVARPFAAQGESPPIKNRDYRIFPSCAKVQNAKKGLLKGHPARVNYEEPFKKRNQIFLHIDEEKLLSGGGLDSPESSTDYAPRLAPRLAACMGAHLAACMAVPPGGTHDGCTQVKHPSPKKETLLFGRKCHGLNKYEYVDERSGKIVVTRGCGVGG
ncbi:hypothetical protein PVIIG_06426 [Plasmodium vivax India VII]|uniref:Uncharacterized protein n=2 Tax=Plasmodium vivax TaxID=5855 RepID=A0A1G4H072_PLAVI|nr:hypothetical protein PVIIG_06426 [Plasmodium vivax India VII]SCO68206.1 conserved Plasmodium protein, unknown function [Plasmodium vivax]